jgi:hypothetical protein
VIPVSQSGSSSLIEVTPSSARKPPLFIVGSARSGNTLLYHTLLSSGGFAVYRTEPVVFDLLVPKFGSLRERKNRSRLLSVWFRTYQFYLSGLNRQYLEEKILDRCRNAGDFLAIVMDEIALQQGVERWAVWGPDNLLHIPEIARTIPNALFVHVIRDGRDVALSMCKEGWIRPFPWDRKRSLLAAGLHWKWKVERGRQFGKQIRERYLEIHFEDLVRKSTETLSNVGRFIGYEFDYDQIKKAPIGAVAEPNSTFKRPDGRPTSDPVGRWRKYLSRWDAAQLESVIGPLLEDLGYPLEFPPEQAPDLSVKLMQRLYPAFFDLKEWLRMRTPMGKFVSTSRLRFNDVVPR